MTKLKVGDQVYISDMELCAEWYIPMDILRNLTSPRVTMVHPETENSVETVFLEGASGSFFPSAALGLHYSHQESPEITAIEILEETLKRVEPISDYGLREQTDLKALCLTIRNYLKDQGIYV